MSGEQFNPLDPTTWRLEASGTEQGQQQIARDQASPIIAQPLVYVLCVLFDLGLLGEGKTFEIPVTTPRQRISVTIKVERRMEGE